MGYGDEYKPNTQGLRAATYEELAGYYIAAKKDNEVLHDELAKVMAESDARIADLKEGLCIQLDEAQESSDIHRTNSQYFQKHNTSLVKELAEANERYEGLEEMYDELYKHHHETVKHPAEPVVVRQTWQNMYAGAFGDEYESRAKVKAALNPWDYGQHLGVLRRDHYSDGTIKVVLEKMDLLEPIGETK